MNKFKLGTSFKKYLYYENVRQEINFKILGMTRNRSTLYIEIKLPDGSTVERGAEIYEDSDGEQVRIKDLFGYQNIEA